MAREVAMGARGKTLVLLLLVLAVVAADSPATTLQAKPETTCELLLG